MVDNAKVKALEMQVSEAFSFTWEELICGWPIEAEHPLVDYVMPFPFLGERKGRVDQYVRRRWYAGLKAEEVTLKKDSWWQQEYIQQDVVAKWGPDTELSMCMCYQEHVYEWRATVREIWDAKVFFNSRNRAAVSVRLQSRDMPMVAVPQAQAISMQRVDRIESWKGEYKKIEKTYVFFVILGPTAIQVRAFCGDATKEEVSVRDGEMSWVICGKPQAVLKELVVPDSLKYMWLRLTYRVDDKRYLDSSYYLKSMMSYTSWTFSIHRSQVEQVLAMCQPEDLLVVPGDGIGVVASLWKGAIVTGDLIVTPFTNVLVEQESFMKTMQRGKERAGQAPVRAVLVLSYVMNMMTDEEKRVVREWDGPVVVVDAKDNAPFSDVDHAGPGVYVKGLRGSCVGGEAQTSHAGQLYSENLLSHPEISYFKESPSVLYFQQMRPMAKANLRGPGTVVVHDLVELVDLMVDGHSVFSYYLACVGKVVEGFSPVAFDLGTDLQPRVVYVVSNRHPVVHFLKSCAHYSVMRDLFYFVVPNALSVCQMDGLWLRSKVAGTAKVHACRLLSRAGAALLMATIDGTKIWSLPEKVNGRSLSSSHEVRRLAMALCYLEKFAQDGWQHVFWAGYRPGKRKTSDQIGSSFYERDKASLTFYAFPWSLRGKHEVMLEL